MWNDLRFGFRTLRRSPVFTAIAVASLALGIGANISIFSLLSQVMFRMLPVADPERLMLFRTEGEREGASMSDNGEGVFTYPMYKDLRDRNQVFSGVIARASAPVSLAYSGQTDRARAELVSGNFFQVLVVSAAIGRVFTKDDDGAPGAHPVVVLTRGYWERRFGANPAIVNQKVTINAHPMIVIGVAARGFHGVLAGDTPDVLVPIAMAHPIAMKREITPRMDILNDRFVRWLSVFARLKPGVSRQQAEAELRVLYRAASEDDLAQKKDLPARGRE